MSMKGSIRATISYICLTLFVNIIRGHESSARKSIYFSFYNTPLPTLVTIMTGGINVKYMAIVTAQKQY
jgi:hypothetical protein